MAITFVSGSYGTSGALNNVSSANATVDAGTAPGRLVVALVLFRATPARTVTSATYNGVAMSSATPSGYNGALAAEVWFLTDADSGSNTVSVTFSGVASQVVVHAAAWVGAATTDVLDNANGGTGTSTTPSVAVTPSENDCLVVGGIIHETPSALTTGSGETALANTDHGAWVTSASYAIQLTAGEQAVNWTAGSSDIWASAVAAFRAGVSNETPTISPNTADAATFTTGTPTVEFTGSDADDDDLRYNVQINTSADFLADGVQVTDSEESSGTGQLVIHPGPAGGLTWEGHQQVDDRPGQVFQGKGGILDKFEFSFGPHESSPEDTDGYYLCRVYAVEGIRGDNVPIWQASTAYSLGNKVRQTSGANANQQFLYECTTAGTSSSTEPTWTEVEDDTISDGSVVWTAHRGAGPLNPADPADTPTPGWLAESDAVYYSPGVAGNGWKTCSFTGDDRIRLEAGTWYCAILDWRPANTTLSNTLTVGVRIAATHGGNCYLDGSSVSNNGPRVGEDTMFRAYEDHVGLDKVSGTDAGFANTVTGGDTDPFNAGEKISYTVQAANELTDSTYYWRARAVDPAGLGNWSDWTTTRTFDVSISTSDLLVISEATHAHAAEAPALTQAHTLTVAEAAHGHAADSANLTQAHSLAVASADHGHTADSIEVAQTNSLAVADASHAHGAEVVSLTQAHNLAVASADQGHAADALTLVQTHQLTAAEAAHAHTADALVLDQTHMVAVAGADHAHAAEALTLTQVHQLATGDSLHAHTAENVTLLQAGSLAVASALHAHAADGVDLAQLHSILVAGVLHGHSADSVILQTTGALLVQDALHGHSTDSVVLSQAHQLAVVAGLHGHTADNITFPGEVTGFGALMVIAGTMGRLFSKAVSGNLHGSFFARAANAGAAKPSLALAPVTGLSGLRLSSGAASGQQGAQLPSSALASQQFAGIAGAATAGGVTQGVDEPPLIDPQ